MCWPGATAQSEIFSVSFWVIGPDPSAQERWEWHSSMFPGPTEARLSMYSQSNMPTPGVLPREMHNLLSLPPTPGSQGTSAPCQLVQLDGYRCSHTHSHTLPGTTDLRASDTQSIRVDGTCHSLGSLQLLAPGTRCLWSQPSFWHPDVHSLQLLEGPYDVRTHSSCWHLNWLTPVSPVTVTQAHRLSNPRLD